MARPDPSRHAPQEIDAYLEPLSEEVRAALERLRRIVRDVAPQATERVSYGIPIFRLRRDLVGMSAQKSHCSLHTMSPQLAKAMAEEVQGYKMSGATLHFGPDRPLPKELVVRILKRRMQEQGLAE